MTLAPVLVALATERGRAAGIIWLKGPPRHTDPPWRLDDPSITMRRLARVYYGAFLDAIGE